MGIHCLSDQASEGPRVHALGRRVDGHDASEISAASVFAGLAAGLFVALASPLALRSRRLSRRIHDLDLGVDQLLREAIPADLSAHQEPTSLDDLAGDRLSAPEPLEHHDGPVVPHDRLEDLPEAPPATGRLPVDGLDLRDEGRRPTHLEVVDREHPPTILVTAREPEEQVRNALQAPACKALGPLRPDSRQRRQGATEQILGPAGSLEGLDELFELPCEVTPRGPGLSRPQPLANLLESAPELERQAPESSRPRPASAASARASSRASGPGSSPGERASSRAIAWIARPVAAICSCSVSALTCASPALLRPRTVTSASGRGSRLVDLL